MSSNTISPVLHYHIPLYKRILSYFYPLTLRRSAGAVNGLLELLLYRNRLQLATADALYSDGTNYKPVNETIRHLKSSVPGISSVLALGTGLGSIVQIMRHNGYHPHFTLIENDKLVLQWALEFMDPRKTSQITPLCLDARVFMNRNTDKYDLIFIDIFNGRVVPPFVTTTQFLSSCRKSLTPGGHVAFNYMIDDPTHWLNTQDVFESVFPQHIILDLGINRVFIGS